MPVVKIYTAIIGYIEHFKARNNTKHDKVPTVERTQCISNYSCLFWESSEHVNKLYWKNVQCWMIKEGIPRSWIDATNALRFKLDHKSIETTLQNTEYVSQRC